MALRQKVLFTGALKEFLEYLKNFLFLGHGGFGLGFLIDMNDI